MHAHLLVSSALKKNRTIFFAAGVQVRRDNCLLVRQMVDTCLRKILIERNVAGAIAHAKNTISDLLQNKLDISLLVVTKSLAKSADDDG